MSQSHGLFERFGVELEYMIVDQNTLDVRPEADLLIQQVAGSVDGDVRRGRLDWSNELALHLIELKTAAPARHLAGLDSLFQSDVAYINRLLASRGARLLPGAMHPWMNPKSESRLWPHSNREIYDAFDKVFNCSGHGWTNLQSTHLNLPFRTPAEFKKLHTAIRLILPLLPALAASSPFMDGKPAPALDMRLKVYRNNCKRIPSIAGWVVPESVQSPTEYRRTILKQIYSDLAPHDPNKILREEWANARGAIARFQRNTIEIRVLDIQECPAADLCLLQAIVTVLRALVEQKISSTRAQAQPATPDLYRLLMRVCARGRRAKVTQPLILKAFGRPQKKSITVGQLWEQLLEQSAPAKAPWLSGINFILNEGSLSERLLAAAGRHPSRKHLKQTYTRLAECLATGESFVA